MCYRDDRYSKVNLGMHERFAQKLRPGGAQVETRKTFGNPSIDLVDLPGTRNTHLGSTYAVYV